MGAGDNTKLQVLENWALLLHLASGVKSNLQNLRRLKKKSEGFEGTDLQLHQHRAKEVGDTIWVYGLGPVILAEPVNALP